MKQASRNSGDNCRQGNERGSVFIEFALVLPILVMLILAAIEFGLAFHEYQVLQNAVREGARFSSLPSSEAPLNAPNRNAKIAVIKQRVIDYCNAERINPPVVAEDVTVDQDYAIAIDATVTIRGSQVSVVHVHSPLTGGALLPGGGIVTLHTSAVFRNMY